MARTAAQNKARTAPNKTDGPEEPTAKPDQPELRSPDGQRTWKPADATEAVNLRARGWKTAESPAEGTEDPPVDIS